VQGADAISSPNVLGARSQWNKRSAAQKSDDFASLHARPPDARNVRSRSLARRGRSAEEQLATKGDRIYIEDRLKPEAWTAKDAWVFLERAMNEGRPLF
jgi:hypothetical protein